MSSDTGHISIRFYEELNDFLPAGNRKRASDVDVTSRRSIKDMVESLGVPHTEIDLILVNGNPVGFDYILRDGDRISVYPVFESFDISSATRLRSRPLRQTRFVLDQHLGRLAAYLRMLGFDTLYRNDFDDPELADISSSQRRILLTCDRRLLMRGKVTHGYFVRSRDPRKQIHEVVSRFDLSNAFTPFSRCMECNGTITSVDKTLVADQLPRKTLEEFDAFWRCESCGKVYWKGNHFDRMQALIDELRRDRK